MALTWNRFGDPGQMSDWSAHVPGVDILDPASKYAVVRCQFINRTFWRVTDGASDRPFWESEVFDSVTEARAAVDERWQQEGGSRGKAGDQELRSWDELEAAFETIRGFVNNSYQVAWKLGYEKGSAES